MTRCLIQILDLFAMACLLGIAFLIGVAAAPYWMEPCQAPVIVEKIVDREVKVEVPVDRVSIVEVEKRVEVPVEVIKEVHIIEKLPCDPPKKKKGRK